MAEGNIDISTLMARLEELAEEPCGWKTEAARAYPGIVRAACRDAVAALTALQKEIGLTRERLDEFNRPDEPLYDFVPQLIDALYREVSAKQKQAHELTRERDAAQNQCASAERELNQAWIEGDQLRQALTAKDAEIVDRQRQLEDMAAWHKRFVAERDELRQALAAKGDR